MVDDDAPPWGDLCDPVTVADRAEVAAQGDWRALLTPEWNAAMDALAAGDPAAVEPAIVFLEVDPYSSATGYDKERLYGHLSHVELTSAQAERLRAFVLRRCREKRYRHELRKLRVLARAVATPAFLDALRAIPRSTDARDAATEEAFIASVSDAVRARSSASRPGAPGTALPR